MKIVVALSIAALTANMALAGVYVESVRRDRVSGAVQGDDKMYLQGGNARMEGEKAGSYMLLKDDGIYHVDTAQRSYRVMDKAAMEQVAGKMSEAMAQMKARMANMPPERRAMMEKMMQMNGQGGAGKAAVYDAIDTGKNESNGGRSCHVWNVTRNGELDQQYCVAPKGSLPGGEEFIAFARKMKTFMDQMRGPLHSLDSGFMQQQIAVLEKINGLPVITRHFTGGKLDAQETVVKTWESRSIPASQFDVPAGFTRKDFMSRPQ